MSHPTRTLPRHARSSIIPLLCATALVALSGGPARAGNQVWTGVSPSAKSIEAIARDPLNASRLWAATFGAGVYRSVNGGSTWTGSRTGLINTFVRCLAIEPQHPDSVFCGTNDGVFLSVDGGVTWKELLSTNRSVRSIAIHPIQTGVIYAATSGSGIFKSLNAGGNWSAINLGLVNTSVRDVALHPAKPETLLAATGTGGGVHRSFNGGLTWTQLADTTGSRNGSHGAAEQIQFDALDPQRVYVAELDRGVLKSTDGGDTWVRVNRGLTSFRGRSIAVVDTLRYFGTDSAGAFFTTLSDTAWHAVNAGLTNGVVNALASAAGSPSSALAGTDGGGIFATSNRGASWSQLDGGLLSTFSFSLAVRPSTHEVYDGSGFGDQFWKSADQGASWSRATSLFSHDSEHGVTPDPLIVSRVYVSAYGAGVYVSDDDGVTFSNPDSLSHTLTNLFVRPLVAWPGQSGHLFAGTGIGPFETVDGGATWTPRIGNLPAFLSVRSIALVVGAPPTLYVGSDSSGVFKSTDGGSNWTQKNIGMVSLFIHALQVDAADSSIVYAATDSGVCKSVNGGDLWARASTGLPAFEVHALAQDAAHGGTLFAGLFGGGVFESVNAGASWFPVFNQNGLSSLNVRALALDPAMLTIYAGTDNGVAALSSYGALDAPVAVTTELSLTAWPNPARGDATLAFTLARASRVRLEVFDLAGQRVRVIEDRAFEAGAHVAAWDGRDGDGRPRPAGLYFVRLDTGAGSRTVRLTRLGR
ncbi:MAG: T9SS type A sorting domain-containing protein [Candidatus Eisenbacteria bacterium]|nr:T9SS type A sorting domain-containing protein [Candidatus Eisenbacteria bacterium]